MTAERAARLALDFVCLLGVPGLRTAGIASVTPTQSEDDGLAFVLTTGLGQVVYVVVYPEETQAVLVRKGMTVEDIVSQSHNGVFYC